VTKHFHHKPVYGGNLTGALLNNAASVSGVATVKVRNNPHDSHFHVENPGQIATYVGAHGTLVIDHDGNWVYSLNLADGVVAGLATGATLTDAIPVAAEYVYRDNKGPTITITITGH
jgi:VCBS repeat-containing protein